MQTLPLPGFASDGIAQGGAVDSELSRQRCGCLTLVGPEADGMNLMPGELGAEVGFPVLVSRLGSSSTDLVGHVVSMGSIVKVLGSDTSRVVASVQGHHRQIAAGQVEGNSRSVHCDGSLSSLGMIEAKLTSSFLGMFGSSPFPARIFVIDDLGFGPESMFDISHVSDHAKLDLCEHDVMIQGEV